MAFSTVSSTAMVSDVGTTTRSDADVAMPPDMRVTSTSVGEARAVLGVTVHEPADTEVLALVAEHAVVESVVRNA